MEVLIAYGACIRDTYHAGEFLEFIAENVWSKMSKMLISNSFIIPEFEEKNRSEARLRVLAVLRSFKKMKLPKDLCNLILSKNAKLIDDIFLIVLPRITKGIERNCLAETMNIIPYFLRPAFVGLLSEHTIQVLRQHMKERLVERMNHDNNAVEISQETLVILDPETLEENFANIIRENIGTRLGFIKK